MWNKMDFLLSRATYSNTLVGYFANWDNNDVKLAPATIISVTRPVSLIYYNIIETDLGPHAPLSGSNALIIKKYFFNGDKRSSGTRFIQQKKYN
jgi:hypothetical protein